MKEQLPQEQRAEIMTGVRSREFNAFLEEMKRNWMNQRYQVLENIKDSAFNPGGNLPKINTVISIIITIQTKFCSLYPEAKNPRTF